MSKSSVVAFVGLGAMGAQMTARLVAAGHDVRGFDVADGARAAARERGVNVVASAGAAVNGASTLILMLPDSHVVEGVLEDPDVVSSIAPGTTIIDMSSSEPLRTRALADRLAARGLVLLDAPVSGGVKGAAAGTLTIMVGGDEAVLERSRPLLDVLGRVVHVGAVGSGHAVKALNNLLSATHLLATGEAMRVGEAFGLAPETMLAVFNQSSGRSGSTENKWPNFILPGTFDSGFALRLMVKDMRIATDLAHRSGVDVRLGDEAVDLWAAAAATLAPNADHTEIARWLDADGERG